MKLLSRALQGAPSATNLSDLIDAARLLNDRYRRQHAVLMNQMSHESWAISYATVRVAVGRQTGSTTYICENATDDSLIVCCNAALAAHVAREVARLGKKAIVVSPAGVATVVAARSIGIRFSTIFVDDTTWQNQHTIDEVYTAAARGDINQQFIFLG